MRSAVVASRESAVMRHSVGGLPLNSAVSRPAYQLRMNLLSSLVMTAALAPQLLAANAAAPGDDLEKLDQVQVYGSQQELPELRQAVIEAEDRFFKRYNELNSNDDFDISCRVEARTGTRLTARTCRPLYQENAVQEGAKQAVEMRQKFQSFGGANQLSTPPVPAAIAILARRPEFERHMRKLVLESPELGSLLEARAAAAEALEMAIRREAKEVGAARPRADTPAAGR